MYDLHVHSNCSDGGFNVHDLILFATSIGIRGFALTDHDTVRGIDEFYSYYSGKKVIPEFISGIELSFIDEHNTSGELLGYFIDYKQQEFAEIDQNSIIGRYNRNIETIQILKKELNYNIFLEEFMEFIQKSTGRPRSEEIIDFLIEKEIIKNKKEGFKIVGRGSQYHGTRNKTTLEMAVSVVRKSGGVAILAHPGLYMREAKPDSLNNQMDFFIERVPMFLEYGIQGFEIYNYRQKGFSEEETKQMNEFVSDLNQKHDLVDGVKGSDFHRYDRFDEYQRNLFASFVSEDSVVEELRRRRG